MEQDQVESTKTIEDYLLQKFSVEQMVQFDEDIAELFQRVFYSFSHDLQMDIDSPGIVTHLLSNWKDTVGVSTISKTLPAVITGSIIEGACLSRLFHPSHEKSLELEADVMYIVGCIDEQIAKQCFQDIGKCGFTRILFSPDIKLFTHENRLSLLDIVAKDPDETDYIDGSKLKIMHKNLQPREHRIQFKNGVTQLVSISQKISGPSSEIVFKIQPILEKHQIDMILEFLEDLENKFDINCNRLFFYFNEISELHQIITTVLEALLNEEKARLEGKPTDLAMEELKEMISKVSVAADVFEKRQDDIYKQYEKVCYDCLATIAIICHYEKDKYFKQNFHMFVLKVMDLSKTFKEATKNAIDKGKLNGDFKNIRLPHSLGFQV